MKKYEKLYEYISYFEDGRNKFCTWKSYKEEPNATITFPYPDYDKNLKDFIDEVYKTDLMKQDYLEFLELNFGSEINPTDIIKNADLKTLSAILTYYIRQERFCDGLWGTAAKEGIFLAILKSLQLLSK